MALGTSGLLATGCQVKDSGRNVVAGKQAFVAKCGSCHVLNRAGTKGVIGPNLDEAFRQARQDGFGSDTFAGIVHKQILYPSKSGTRDPATGRTEGIMRANLVEGKLARDVAEYVARVAGTGGKDTGALANAVPQPAGQGKTARADGGELAIPADPSGQLAYQFGAATSGPGALTISSENEASVPHNIALEGSGVDEKGAVVQGGAVSKISVDVQAGEYTFYCSVPGHREGGMLGKLTVK